MYIVLFIFVTKVKKKIKYITIPYPLLFLIIILLNTSTQVVLLSLRNGMLFRHFPLPFRFASLFRFTLINFTFFFLTLFSKFYFNFPSQYLFAIGLTVIFSVRCHLPSTYNFHTSIPRCTTLKNIKVLNNSFKINRYETFTLFGAAFQQTYN